MDGDVGDGRSVGSADHAWRAQAPVDAFKDKFFSLDEDGFITFGWSGRSERPRTLEDLNEWTRFRDYVMEGFVFYDLRLVDDDSYFSLEVRLLGMNRDGYVANNIEFYLNQAEIDYQACT